MKTIINNIKNRLTKLIEAVRYHYINYKVDIYDNTVLINSLFNKLHDLEKKPKIDDLESNRSDNNLFNRRLDDLESKLDDLESNLGDLEYKLDDVEYKADDIIVEADIEEMITETIEELNVLPKNDVKYFKSMLNCSDIKQALEDVIFSAMSSEYAEKTILNKVPETNTTDDHKLCVPQTPAQRLTNNILNYYGGDWNAEDFNNCFEIVNKYDIKLKKAVKGGK